MDEYGNERKSYDHLFEDISVATGMGIAGATLLFRNGYGREINDAIIKSKIYLDGYSNMLLDHLDDLTEITKDVVEKTSRDIHTAIEYNKHIGNNFRASDTMAIDGLFKYWQAEINPNDVTRKLYESDLRDVVKASIESVTGLPEEVMEAFKSNMGTFANYSSTPKYIHAQLIKKIGKENFAIYADAINKIIDDTEDWKKVWTYDDGNDVGTWMKQKGNAVLESYKKGVADWEEILAYQEERKKSLGHKISKGVLPDRNLTIEEFMQIDAGPESENRDLIRRMFSRDRTIQFKPSNIDKIAPRNSVANRRFRQRFGSGDKTISLSALDLIRIQYEKLEGKEKEAFGKIELSNVHMGKDNKIYTVSGVKGIGNDTLDFLANVFPFKMLRTGDYRAQRLADQSVIVFKAGDYNPVIAKAADHNNKDGYLGETVIKKFNKYYKLDENNNEIELDSIRGSKAMSAKTGAYKIIMDTMGDGIARKSDSRKNLIERTLGIELETAIKLSEENGSNQRFFAAFNQAALDYLKGIQSAAEEAGAGISEYYDVLELGNRANKFQKFLNRTTYGFNRNQLKTISNAIENTDPNRRFLDYIDQLDRHPEKFQDIMESLAKVDDLNTTYKNPELVKFIRKYTKDPDIVRQLYSSTLKDPMAKETGQYISLSFKDALKKELSKEFLSKYEDEYGYEALTDLLKKNLRGTDRDKAIGLAAAQKYLTALGFPYEKTIDGDDYDVLDIQKITQRLEDLTNDNSTEAKLLKKQIQDFVYENADLFRDVIKQDAKDQVTKNAAEYMVVKPYVSLTEGVQSILTPINEGNYDKARENAKSFGKRFFKQFLAGPGDPENFTEATAYTAFITSKINNEFKWTFRPWYFKENLVDIDLRVKGKDASTVGNLLKAWGIKRIGAAWLGYKIYDFADDMTKASTGMGITEAGMSGLANSYLGIKKITGALGLDESLKSLSQDNAILNYFGEYTGEIGGEWNTYEEQKDYYENGYTPIRKARYWWFGSSNEFRGGRISYFEPNTLRSLKSDYKDMSLYNGSYWNKWNPINILDPYYLENLHKEDRPYPISGSLFEENTPWGVVLNPTVGAILKPKVRLNNDRLQNGVDVKALIYQMNRQIRDKSVENNNLFYLQNGKLRSMDFMAYNAPEYSSRILTLNDSDRHGKEGFANEYGYYNTPVAINDDLYNEVTRENQKFIANNKELTAKDKIAIEAAKGNKPAQLINAFAGSSSLNILREQNQRILAKAGYDKTQGMMVENKLSATKNPVDEMLDNSEDIAELMQAGSGNDYVHEMAVSARMITGLYGWGASKALDIGQNNQDRIATSADMYSNSRAFWDMNMGGAGGNIMEISRRFFPEYRRFQTKNPLMNTMPDWLPDRLKFGDAYTELPNGEARLPGLGYESLNKLHADIFGSYGAYDRFKILADVAPYSPEYKFWKSVASKTVTDPYLRADIEKIKERVKLQSKQHDFQEYKYVDRDVDRRNAYITEIGKNGTFKIYGSDETYKIAGAKIKANPNESQEQILERYIRPGQLVSIMIDTNDAYARNSDKNRTINAAVLVDGENVSAQMIKNGDATKRQSDLSSAAYMANHGNLVNSINWLSEKFMHADLPIIHNRWFRANSALEDYQDEYLYGTSFQSWDDIWQTFILPNARKEAASTFWTGAGIAADILRNNILGDNSNAKNNLLTDLYYDYIKEDGPLGYDSKLARFFRGAETQRVIRQSSYMLDRGGLAGYLTGKFINLGSSEQMTKANRDYRRIGSAFNLAFSAIAAPENLGVSVMSWSRLSYLASNEFFGGKMRGAAALAGAAIGVARWAGSKHLLSDDPYDTQYIPDAAKKRWEMQDYFDRLTYLKYTALYEKAADKALSKEGVDIKNILERQEEETRNIKETKLEISQALDALVNINTQSAAKMRQLLMERTSSLEPSKVPLSGGEYTKSAIMYYNAAKATMYALDENSSMADVIRALPKTDREYFMEFLKEKDEEKRQEILSYVSPQIRKALNMFWYKKYDKPESNEEFFTKHSLPGPLWSGWNPNIDLADVQAKVINNEGMNYSDFGIYASQYREPEVMNAPVVEYSSHDSLMESSLKIKTLLSGLGLTGVDISVEPYSGDTLQVLANVSRVVDYKLDSTIINIFEGI